jgi:hypothetical protein
MKTYEGVDVQTQVFLTVAPVGSKWSSLYPSHITPGKEPIVSTRHEAWCAPETVWTIWKREKSWLQQDSVSNSSVVQPVASRCTDPLHASNTCLRIISLPDPSSPPSDFFPQLLRPKLFAHFPSSHRVLLYARLQPEVNIRNSWCIFVYNVHFLEFSGSKLVLDHFGSVLIQIKSG